MQTLVIDTNGIVKKLEQRGFSRAQAEGITEALKELDTSGLDLVIAVGFGASPCVQLVQDLQDGDYERTLRKDNTDQTPRLAV